MAATWWRYVVSVLVGLAIAGCLDSSATRCSDGSACRPGTICVDGLGLCAKQAQLDACRSMADGTACRTADIPRGTCTMNVCVGAGCGNGIVDEGEACDDKNTLSGDGCSADCLSTEVCGNKIVDRNEQCDCGTSGDVNPDCRGPNDNASGACNRSCRLRCGDGIIAADEGCDPGASAVVSCAGEDFDRGLTTCTASCTPLLSPTSCRYIGWRTHGTQSAVDPNGPVIELAPTGVDAGFFIKGTLVSQYANFVGTGTPYAAAAPLHGVWAAGPNAAVAVGDLGTIVTFDGTAWSAQSSGTTETLVDVWGRAADDVYAIGPGVALHYDGASWSAMTPPTGTYRAVAGDASALYVAGDAGFVARYNGAWQTIATPTTADLRGIWSTGAAVVAVGSAGVIVQNLGAGWELGRTATTADLASVWGSATDGFVAVGDRGTLLFFDGRVWRPLAAGRGLQGSPSQPFDHLVGIEGVSFGAVGSEDLPSYEGAAWSPMAVPTSETLYGLWGLTPDDVFAVGRNGTILHYDGLTWEIQDSGVAVDLHAVSGTGPTDVYAAGDDLTLLHFDGATWTTLHSGALASGGAGILRALFVGPTFVLAGGDEGIFSFASGVMTRESTKASNTVWAASATDRWSASAGVMRDIGGGWKATSLILQTLGLAGTSSQNLYAVGPQSFHFNGAAWTAGPFTDASLQSVAVSPTLGAFAVGTGGALQYWNGTDLDPMNGRTTANLHAVLSIGHLVFMAGDDGALELLVLHR